MDHFLYKLDSSNNWAMFRPGSEFSRVAVDPSGNPWAISLNTIVWRWTGSQWVQFPGAAYDIGIGADGTVWVTGINYNLYKWDGNNGWVAGAGNGAVVTVDASGRAWMCTTDGKIYRQISDKWVQLPGAGTDIGVGADGSAYIVGTDTLPGGGGIYRYLHSA